MKLKKVLFIIPDGVGIRNYLYSDVIKNLKDQAEIVFWSTLPQEAFDETFALHQVEIEYKRIVLPNENAITRLFRESATYARLVHNAKIQHNETILSNWNKSGKGIKLQILYTIAEKIGNWASKDYQRILNLEKKSRDFWDRKIIEETKSTLLELQPTSIFITHQRVASLMPICIAAKELGIKVNTAIYSWDNLPKARMAVLADNYFVWSKYMKNEMQEYYPEVKEENVIVTGTPQFEFYLDNNRILSRDDFAKRYNLDENKKWICFSGDDVLTSPFDAGYLNDVAEAIDQIPESERPQLIFRRCPVDFSNRYNIVLEKFKNSITIIDPMWVSSATNWGSVFPKVADVDLLVTICFHCDMVINLGSTMALDFSIFNKPCFYLNYDPVQASTWTVRKIYEFQHFRSMNGFEAVGWLNSKNEITEKIKKALEYPITIGKDKRPWVEKIVNHPLENSSKLIAEKILQ